MTNNLLVFKFLDHFSIAKGNGSVYNTTHIHGIRIHMGISTAVCMSPSYIHADDQPDLLLLLSNGRWDNHNFLSLFSTGRIRSRVKRKKQLDWLATNTDNITTQ